MLRPFVSGMGTGARDFFSGSTQTQLVSAMLVPANAALFNIIFASTIEAHPLAPAGFTAVVFVGGRLCDPPLYEVVSQRLYELRGRAEQGIQEEHLATWSIAQIIRETGTQFGRCFLATITYAAVLYLVYMSSLGLDIQEPGLLLSGAITLVVLTLLFPTLFLLGTMVLINNIQLVRRIEFLFRNIGGVREAAFSIAANLLVLGVIGPNT